LAAINCGNARFSLPTLPLSLALVAYWIGDVADGWLARRCD